MQHEPWPSLPPGGHRPPDYPPFTSPGDQLLAVGLGAAAGAGALVWATGQAAGLAFGQDAAQGAIVGQLSGLMGQQTAEALEAMIRGASDASSE